MGDRYKNELTVKQQRFVDCYDGNASQAAEMAGYSHPGITGHRLLKNPKVAGKIRERENKEINPAIASRKERQEFWTKMLSTAEKDSDRLKASELLGRSEADFIERVKTEHDLSGNLMAIIAKVSSERNGKGKG